MKLSTISIAKHLSLGLVALIATSLLVSCSDSDSNPSKDSGSGVISNDFTLVLNSPMPSDAVVWANGAHGTCTISAGFDQITYTRADSSFTGRDDCFITHSSCTYEYWIDFSQPNPSLIDSGAVSCN
ncbi:MAG: hypothetical protein V4596_10130 [Bdellovibrionota bacterium]